MPCENRNTSRLQATATGPFASFAEALLEAGYSPLPIIPGRKKPALREWSNYCAAPMPWGRIRDYGARWPRASLGVALGYAGLVALDVDTEDAAQLAAICAAVPASPVAKTGAKGFTAFYRAAPGVVIPSRHYAGRPQAGDLRSAQHRHANGAAAIAAPGRACLSLVDA